MKTLNRLMFAGVIVMAATCTLLTAEQAAVQKTSGGWDAASRYQKLVRSGTSARLKGNVLSTEDLRPYEDMEPGVQLKVDVGGGKEVSVHLGPRWFVLERDIAFTRGEPIEIVGVKIQIGDKPAVIASEVVRPESKQRIVFRESSGTPRWFDRSPAGPRE